MKLTSVLILVAVGLTLGLPEESGVLELVQILYRHGDRAPTHVFPTDTHQDYWTDGLGQLTNVGKQQLYDLGDYIKQRYGTFLNHSYNHENVLVNSSDSDRCLMSAYANMAGLYPPEDGQVWNPDLLWQPIPVHTLPEIIDYFVGCDGYCPVADALVEQQKQSPEMQQINEENADLYALVANETGTEINDIWDLNHIYDTLFCEQCHNLSWPDWVYPVWPRMVECHSLKFEYEYKPPPICRLRGGPLLGHMIGNMQAKINGEATERQAFVYSSHDSMVAAFLSALGVYNDIAPPYFSTVFVELHALPDGDHGVQILYRNSTADPPFDLAIPNCTSPCPIDQFANLTAPMVPTDLLGDCGLTMNDMKQLLMSEATKSALEDSQERTPFSKAVYM